MPKINTTRNAKNKNTPETIPAGGAYPAGPLEIHPLADIFPEMTEAELNELAEDIQKHGQRETIRLFEGKVLDGRNRYKACLLKGIRPRCVNYAGDDPVALVVSENLHRRHLNESQRAMVAAKLANLPHGGDRSKSPNGGLPQADAAKLMNVGKRSVERASEVTKHGVPELAKAVTQGEVKVSVAAEIAKMPKAEQALQIMDAGSVRAMTELRREQRLTRKAKEKKAKARARLEKEVKYHLAKGDEAQRAADEAYMAARQGQEAVPLIPALNVVLSHTYPERQSSEWLKAVRAIGTEKLRVIITRLRMVCDDFDDKSAAKSTVKDKADRAEAKVKS